MRSTQRATRGMLLEGGRWELLVAIVLGFVLTVAVGRVTSAALALIAPEHDAPAAAAAVSHAVAH